jgi:hypothetical protein
MMLRFSRCFLLGLIAAALASFALAEDHSVAIDIRNSMPFVQVMVNGQGPFTFSIDTGTGGQALVSPELIQKLNLPVVGEEEVGDPSGLNSHKVPAVKINSLKVAGIEFKDVRATQHHASQREGQCDGILGFPLFRDYLFTMDYPGKQMTIASGSLKPDGGDQVIPFTMPNDVPLIELVVEPGSQKLEAHLDSRGWGLSFPEKFAQGLKFVSAPIVIARGRTVSNEFEIKGATLAGDVRLGGYILPQPFIAINPLFPVGNFGALPLQNFAVTFDQKNKLIRLVAASKSIVLPPPMATRGPSAPATH